MVFPIIPMIFQQESWMNQVFFIILKSVRVSFNSALTVVRQIDTLNAYMNAPIPFIEVSDVGYWQCSIHQIYIEK